jgi:hypothetical protein
MNDFYITAASLAERMKLDARTVRRRLRSDASLVYGKKRSIALYKFNPLNPDDLPVIEIRKVTKKVK